MITKLRSKEVHNGRIVWLLAAPFIARVLFPGRKPSA
jgi:hypothetical protein